MVSGHPSSISISPWHWVWRIEPAVAVPAGFYIPKQLMPVWWRWFWYCNPVSWMVRARHHPQPALPRRPVPWRRVACSPPARLPGCLPTVIPCCSLPPTDASPAGVCRCCQPAGGRHNRGVHSSRADHYRAGLPGGDVWLQGQLLPGPPSASSWASWWASEPSPPWRCASSPSRAAELAAAGWRGRRRRGDCACRQKQP